MAVNFKNAMNSVRQRALAALDSREPVQFKGREGKISDYFACNVFTLDKMEKYLSKDVFRKVKAAIEGGTRIDRSIADQVAEAMKIWVIERGATHYTHWFQPLNELTAEKHDAFLEPDMNGGSFESFSGSLLVQQEPDASSFPSGGLRNTFEARGYSAWDPSSPAFIMDKTLCIPSIFISYNGEALDFKTPLLRSMAAVDKAAVEVCSLFTKDVTRVVPNLGWEQEYFLVDEALYASRPDLMQTGRTLMGHTAAKDQQLDDHYWGAIPERVMRFMEEFEEEAYKLGVPIKTRHNEAAPNQFECAPKYEEVNIAVDHNLLLMSVMRKIAPKHHLKVLFHEKPFAGVNGSGKHCNWSLATDTGVNLMAPGKNPKSNIRFLAFFVCVLKAAADYGSLIMASVASQGNSHRLGGNEAPPAVLSVFTGATMDAMLGSIEKSMSDKMTPESKSAIKLHIGKIPEIMFDNTDRNRTSPFAFTGNRFEFRAVGSDQSIAGPLVAINTMVAESLDYVATELEQAPKDCAGFNRAVQDLLQRMIRDNFRVIFNGDNYSEEWHREAERRGLPKASSTPEALDAMNCPATIEAFTKYGVLSEREVSSRFEIYYERYIKDVMIEARLCLSMARTMIFPAGIKYQQMLATTSDA